MRHRPFGDQAARFKKTLIIIKPAKANESKQQRFIFCIMKSQLVANRVGCYITHEQVTGKEPEHSLAFKGGAKGG